jgi:tRNA(Met) C34 N-acetyltransferase TmcA
MTIGLYAHHYRAFEDCAPILFNFILHCFSNKLTEQLVLSEQQLLCMRALQGRSIITCVKQLKLNGKKQMDQTMRAAVSKLLALLLH